MKPTKLSFKEAAIQILKRFSEPKTPKEITSIAIEEGLVETQGETPDATLGALIYTDIKTNKQTPFKKVGKGLFTLNSTNESANSPHITIYNQNELVKDALRKKLHTMDPFQFEYLIADLLQKIGYENVEVTKRTGDKGIDIKANLTVGGLTNVKTVIQVKRYNINNKIDGKIIAQLRGSAEVDQRGLVITTSSFQKSAIEEAKAINKMPVALVDGDKLINLLIKYELGIKKNHLVVISIDEDYFENSSSTSEQKADNEKSRSIWPLPGGTNSYVETLNLVLETIERGTNKKSTLIKWMINNFENVESEKTTWSYLNVPRNMGLVEMRDSIFTLTKDGNEYFKNRDLDFLYQTISKNILAFSDIYEFLKTIDKPQNDEQILDFLKENFDIGWTTFAQVRFRLQWLVNLKKLKSTDDGYMVIK